MKFLQSFTIIYVKIINNVIGVFSWSHTVTPIISVNEIVRKKLMISYYNQARKSLLLISSTIIRFRTETLKYIVTYVYKDVRMTCIRSWYMFCC